MGRGISPTRRPAADRALCLHEAAHAVAGEVLSPGVVVEVRMDYAVWTITATGEVFGDGTEAVTSWRWPTDSPDFSRIAYATAVAAAKYGEGIEPDPVDHYTRGDDAQLRTWYPDCTRIARRRAKSLVKTHELAIRRVAAALATRRTMSGAEIREVMV